MANGAGPRASTADVTADVTVNAATAATTAPVVTDDKEAAAATGVKRKADLMLSEENPFPSSVTEKFFPNRCDLCSVVFPVARDIAIPEKGGMEYMESNLQSTMHYGGKSHKKRLRQFMQDFCARHRLVTPRRARELMRDTPAVPRADQKDSAKVDLYCKICDLSFTSVQHASQHYAGRNHVRKLEGKPPLRTGYYNSRLGRWQRLPVEEQQSRPYPPRPTTALRPADGPVKSSLAAALADPSVVTVQVAPGNLVNAGGRPTVAAAAATASGASGAAPSKFFCHICNVSATCQLQLDTHINGSKHKLQARKLGLPLPEPPPVEPTAAGEQAAQDETTSATEPPAKRPHKDFSIYKTPSGKFYCLPCNLTMNSETQFAQHFESKKHKSEVAKQRSTVRSAY
ncbi:zinc finger matrin-type protein 3-like [Pollicipes pollicipes]|uniref:zinc finger matrin-type protein 3-like n=1 Tax=Pollicipes pollicipes TaxID=41117 RepID=UPI0018851B94|nr:zinc finger matrin-type protein 3-like [Pollicipes pollicipes]